MFKTAQSINSIMKPICCFINDYRKFRAHLLLNLYLVDIYTFEGKLSRYKFYEKFIQNTNIGELMIVSFYSVLHNRILVPSNSKTDSRSNLFVLKNH